jgi:hypothetical protein
MRVDLQNATADRHVGLPGEGRAFVLLESARLRCEALIACFGHREHLVRIHREIGLAGYETCDEFDGEERVRCLELATVRLIEDPVIADDLFSQEAPEMTRSLAKMFSETISASDALAGELATQEVDEVQRDRLHLVHAHVMSACELLDERLTVLELQGAGVDAAL